MNIGKKIAMIAAVVVLAVMIVTVVIFIVLPKIPMDSSGGGETPTNESTSKNGDDDIQKQLDETVKSIKEDAVMSDQEMREKVIEAMEKARKQYSDNGNTSRADAIKQQIDAEKSSTNKGGSHNGSSDPSGPQDLKDENTNNQ
jgi:preprotein translocase subunit SecF